MKYSYLAKNLKGEEESGVLEAHDQEGLSRLLRQRGFFLVSCGSDAVKGHPSRFQLPKLGFLSRFIGVSLTDRLFFTRNIEIMIKTGMSLTKAFEILALQSKSKKFSLVLRGIGEQVAKGESLSQAMSSYPDVFSVLYQETIKVGEETGQLEESFRTLALQMEKEHHLKSKVKSAMVYPVIVLSLTGVVGVLMMIFAVPKLKQTFTDLNVTLPLTTQVILFVADFMSKQWLGTLVIGAGLVVLLYLALTIKALKKPKSWLTLRIPLIAPLTKKMNSALMLRTLSSLFKSGVPIIRALNITANSLSNYYFQQGLREAALKIEKGRKLAEALKPYESLYPVGVLQMVEVGEETGETAEVLKKLAEFYEEGVAASTEQLSAVIEPFLILFIGAIVGFFAISMMQPMFSMMGGVK